MNRILAIGMFLSFLTFRYSLAQTCTQTLRLAQETYNAGRLHELPKICEKCLEDRNEDHFSTQEKVTAYKLLTQAYIYLEEPELADKSMLNLLSTDGFFEVNEAIDPAEFLALYKKFRTRPVISVAFKFGLTYTFAEPTLLYNVGSGSNGGGKFSPALGIYYGIGAEKVLSGKTKKRKIIFAPELFLMNKAYTFEQPVLFFSDVDNTSSVARLKSTYTQSRFDFYPTVHFELFQKSSLNPFIGIGPGISYLNSASNDDITTLTDVKGNSINAISGKTLTSTKSFAKITYSAIMMAGVKLRVGPLYITADVRYQYGFSNLVNVNRTNPESLFDYGYQFPDFKTSNVMGTVGAIYPIFIPKKLVK